MDIQEFACRLNTSSKNQEHKQDEKKQDEKSLKSLEIYLNLQLYTQAWSLMETIIDECQDLICSYLTVIGDKHWSETGYTGPNNVDKELLTRKLYSGCMCFTQQIIEIDWKVENQPTGLLCQRHSSMFGVRLVFEVRKYKNALGGGSTNYSFQVLDNCGYHGHIKEIQDLALALIESSDRGPYSDPSTDLV